MFLRCIPPIICWTLLIILGIPNIISYAGEPEEDQYELLLATVATEQTDGLRRLNRSANHFGHRLHVFGLEESWLGGDMHYAGGAQKIRILRDNLEPFRGRDKLVVLFTDAYDVIINADAETILRKFFFEFPKTRILFGAEPFCWPNRTLAPKYPPVVFGERYLNSGMFIGFVGQLLEMLDYAKEMNVRDNDDDQLFYTRLYLDQEIRNKLHMALDPISFIFQNLNGMYEFVGIAPHSLQDGAPMLENSLYNTNALILHGNGPSKGQLNVFGNYLMQTTVDRYKRNSFDISELGTLPTVAIAVFVLKPIPYVEEFLQTLDKLDYPMERILLRIHNNQQSANALIENYAKAHSADFALLEIFSGGEASKNEHQIRANALHWAQEQKVDFLLLLDADAHLTAPDAIKRLVAKASEDDNYFALLAPLLLRPGTMFSNFWGALSESGYYARAFDYVDIAQGKLAGVWNVPFIGSAIFVSGRKFAALQAAYQWNVAMDSDIVFAQYCRENGHFMYVDATMGPEFYGFLVNTDGFANLPAEARFHLELYDYPNNLKLWERRYIHPEYFSMLQPDQDVPLACPDVYDFPFLSERFCQEIIEVMEDFGQWSEGKNQDKRIQGGYENVPTRDIHMNQVGFSLHWLKIMDEYVAPVQEKVFIGFYQRPVQSSMMFVVRYRPDEQASLRPHHDASTYSIDVALNRRDVDYEGGGVRYVRYNCTVPADRVGWSMLFPGRLTHLHEGLPTTRGTRYILVSFINP